MCLGHGLPTDKLTHAMDVDNSMDIISSGVECNADSMGDVLDVDGRNGECVGDRVESRGERG
jgi:hypothetical protein